MDRPKVLSTSHNGGTSAKSFPLQVHAPAVHFLPAISLIRFSYISEHGKVFVQKCWRQPASRHIQTPNGQQIRGSAKAVYIRDEE